MGKYKGKILISASGTGGHLIPAMQLANILKNDNFDIFFAAKDLSKKEIFDKTLNFVDISSDIPRNLFFIFKIFKGFLQSVFLIFKYKPDIIVGFGSFHTFPVILAGYVLRKKIVLFDSNILLGKVNKFFSKKVKFVATQFPILNQKNAVLVKKLPWYVANESVFLKDFKKNIFTILVFGGSQGSKIINENFLKILKDLYKKITFQVIHITGEDSQHFKKIYDEMKIINYVKKFEKNIYSLYRNADLVISRSGAITIAELLNFNKPAILIPFKNATDNHQLKNAEFIQNNYKFVKIIEEDHLNQLSLLKEIEFFINDNFKNLKIFKENILSAMMKEEKDQNVTTIQNVINKVLYE
ncbi:MAG: hypothetical protein A3F40_00355 [Chlamydiae bacterium RIFCSPHIGHO2_12_FULL_27_8]|nr:MAG: hypothetical protein A3F40_00355 [Chlamydiae bacterium RIFCSPHIGHO2_12_FULL_27_8]